jgi:hypothetical protein
MLQDLYGEERSGLVTDRQERAAVGTTGVDWRQAVRPLDRACCCPAGPMFRIVMPATGGRGHPTDLLLCGHHYRVSRAALTAVGASVYDASGKLLDLHSPTSGFMPER